MIRWSRWPVVAGWAASATLVVALLVLLSGVPVGPGGGAGASRPLPSANLSVLVGASGLRWADVGPGTTPTLARLTQTAAVASLSVAGQGSSRCIGGGWATLSAGVVSGPGPAVCPPAPAQVGAAQVVPGWGTYLSSARRGPFHAQPGLLGQALHDGDVAVATVGGYAAVGGADRSGHPVGSDVLAVDDASLARQVAAAVRRLHGQLTEGRARRAAMLIDLGSLTAQDPFERARQARALDGRAASVVSALPRTASVVLSSLGEPGPTPHLQVLAVHLPQPVPGAVLSSASTRQPGLAQLTDVPATLLAILGVHEPTGFSGRPLTMARSSTPSRQAGSSEMAAADRAATTVMATVPWFFTGVVLAQLLILIGVGWGLQRHSQHLSRNAAVRLRRVGHGTALVGAAVPAGTFLANLAPWWTTAHPSVTLTVAACTASCVVAIAAARGPWRRHPWGPAAAVAAFTCVLLIIDFLTGSRLQVDSLLGLQPLIGGRYYGVGNVALGVQVTAALLLAAALASPAVGRGYRGLPVVVVALVALPLIVVDSGPTWGAKFGAIPVLVPAFAVLALRLGRLRVTALKAAVIAGLSVLLLAAACLVDYLRPAPQRGHLGQFVQTLLDGQAGPIVARKAGQDLDLLLTAPLAFLIPVGLVAVSVVVHDPGRWHLPALARTQVRLPTLRPALGALLVALCVGLVGNDTGVAIPAVSALVVLPVLAALTLHPGAQPEAERQ